ncbi:MAG TPA: undecaprenyldiphospho-muramoylpentapeptide beta-N-acetylglucosaminyltransferase [Gammaproteobacteria bacterium]|nr:undecaprenyldiphospho-muramoylpentapeptide beta-N-acetylglucosaminyltransferase [Gammaproteobacteria bacterium]
MSAAPILIMAGGTGGHVFPGLAVAEALLARNQSVVWLGTRRGLEAELVPAREIDIEWISIAGVRGRGFGAWIVAPFKIVWAMFQALAVMVRRRPGAVLGLGGFVAGPGGIAAWLARKPLVIHEQNAVAGTTNRLLARFASRVFEAFANSFPASAQAIEIGNPVRASILARRHETSDLTTADRPVHLLVLGGSQGALALNRAVPAAIARLRADLKPTIRHQAGRSLEAAEQAYRMAGVESESVAFIDDMAEAYAWADIVVARAGALTLSELAAAGVGAILVPFPHAIDDHQRKNAEVFAAAGAALIVPQDELEAEPLAAELTRLFADRAELVAMGKRCRSLARPDAARVLADACIDLAGARP